MTPTLSECQKLTEFYNTIRSSYKAEVKFQPHVNTEETRSGNTNPPVLIYACVSVYALCVTISACAVKKPDVNFGRCTSSPSCPC